MAEATNEKTMAQLIVIGWEILDYHRILKITLDKGNFVAYKITNPGICSAEPRVVVM